MNKHNALATTTTQTSVTHPATTPNPAPAAAAVATPPVTAPLSPTEQQTCFNTYKPIALALPATGIKPFRGNVTLVTANAARGAAAILASAAQVQAAWPSLDVAAISSVRDIGNAFSFASFRVARYATPKEVKALVVEAHKLRSPLMAAAVALANAGVFPAVEVDEIRKGRGPVDAAADLVALAELYRRFEAQIAGKTAITGAEIQAAGDLGTRLLEALSPAGLRKQTDDGQVAAVDLRDRLWTLLETTWQANVWRAGAYLFNQDVDAHVPPLHSRVFGRRKPAATPAPATTSPAPTAEALAKPITPSVKSGGASAS